MKAPRAGIRLLALLVAGATATPLAAQDPPAPDRPQPAGDDTAATAAAQDTVDAPLTPGGAFVRSLLVPGWGQAEFGAYLRGGVYFAAHTGSAFMVFKTMVKLGEARDLEARREAAVRDSVRAVAPTDSAFDATIMAALEADSVLTQKRNLIESREQQREDWIAWLLFWTLIGGVDAYVTAQLADFPAEVIAEPTTGGGARVGLRVRTGGVP